MRTEQFQLAMSDMQIPTFIRNIANKAVKDLKETEVSADPIIVTDKEFALICKYSNQTPLDGRCYSFIRIEDELWNSIDIQTKRNFVKTIFTPLFDTYGTKQALANK